MPTIDPDDGYLTVFNLFNTRTFEDADTLLETMRGIIDHADYQGWVSSTLHRALDSPATANFIQWRSLADLEARYAGATFKHMTVPHFSELSTSVQLLKTEVVSSHRHPDVDVVEIGPQQDLFTVIVVMGVAPENQSALVDLFAADPALHDVPGYRSNTILRGIDGDHVVNYAQWEDRASYESFHRLPEEERPPSSRAMRDRARQLLVSRDSNSYRVVHSRSTADLGTTSPA
jgi:heme-degrading monooxygenase HmoA